MALTLDDLIGKCDGCGGTGKKPQPPPVGRRGGGFGQHSTTYPLNASPEDCGRCSGTGHQGLTETGRAIVALLEVVKKYDAQGRLSVLKHEARDSSVG